MPTTTQTTSHLEQQLEEVIALYGTVLDEYSLLAGMSPASEEFTSTASQKNIGDSFDILMQLEEQLQVSLARQPEMSGKSIILLRQRTEILGQLQELNRQISRKAENAKSLLEHEMHSLGAHRNAIHGYKPAGISRKNILNSTY